MSDRVRLTWVTQPVPAIQKEAAGTGLYGYTKSTQNDVERATKSLSKQAVAIAKRIYSKDPEVVDFLYKHATRANSPVAAMLLSAMKEIGPKVPDLSVPAGTEPTEPVGDMGDISKTASATTKNLYGHKTRTASLGIQACGELRLASGQIGSDLHTRRADRQADILGYLDKAASEGKCTYSSLLRSGYPELPENPLGEPPVPVIEKTASQIPEVPATVADWLRLKT